MQNWLDLSEKAWRYRFLEFHYFKIWKFLQSWQVKSSLGAVRSQNGPLLSLKADDDPRMALQFPTITSFIWTVEGLHPQSKTEDGLRELFTCHDCKWKCSFIHSYYLKLKNNNLLLFETNSLSQTQYLLIGYPCSTWWAHIVNDETCYRQNGFSQRKIPINFLFLF